MLGKRENNKYTENAKRLIESDGPYIWWFFAQGLNLATKEKKSTKQEEFQRKGEVSVLNLPEIK